MNDLVKQELRSGWLGMPGKFSPLDFAGAGLGAYMTYMGIRELQRARTWQGMLAIGLGGLMIWIHTQRFFAAPQDQGGFIRLANDLGITQLDLDRLRPMLPPGSPVLEAPVSYQ